MSTKNVVNQLSLKNYKRVSKATFDELEIRLFVNKDPDRENDIVLCTEDKDGNVKKLDHIEDSAENSDFCENLSKQYFNKIKDRKNQSHLIDKVLEVLNESKKDFLLKSLVDVVYRNYGESKLGSILKDLEKVFDRDLWDSENYPEKFDPNNIELSFCESFEDESVGNSCFSIRVCFDQETVLEGNELDIFNITTD